MVVQWDAQLKLSLVYEPAFDIFSGKAHKSPPLDTKRTMLLDITSRPFEEYFLCGTIQAADFEKLKKQCFTGWTCTSARNRVWTMAYTAEKLALLLVIREQVDSEKKVRASSRAGGASATWRGRGRQQLRRMEAAIHHPRRPDVLLGLSSS